MVVPGTASAAAIHLDLGRNAEPAHRAEMEEVRAQCRAERGLRRVADAVLRAVPPHDPCDLRVVRMRHPREQVMLDLEVEAAEHPGQHRVARAKVHRRLDLVYGPDRPLGTHLLGGCERCLLDAVGELEGRRHDQAGEHREAEVGHSTAHHG